MGYFKALSIMWCAAIGVALLLATPALAAGDKVTICHIPPGNPENVQIIDVSASAAQNHMDRHGDSLFGAVDLCDGVDNDCDGEVDEDCLGFTWVPIPAGTMMMGCSPGDLDCDTDELPPHFVMVEAFEMMETEVTQAQYDLVTGATPSYHQDCLDCPVEKVSWFEATAFCDLVDGRLPTEPEWEYAARGGTTTEYYCGDDPACLDDIAWYAGNSYWLTQDVGQKTPNVYGLYDILGNVKEWVNGCYHYSYDSLPDTAYPAWTDPCSGGVNNTVNHSCAILHMDCRVSHKVRLGKSNWNPAIGFRCVR